MTQKNLLLYKFELKTVIIINKDQIDYIISV